MKTLEKINNLNFKVIFNGSNINPRGYRTVTARRGTVEITAPNLTTLLKRVRKQPKHYKLIFEDKAGNELKTVEISADTYSDAILQKKIALQNSLINNLYKIHIRK